jgi:TatA/E family protein of Tat protein translocase
MFGLQPVHLVIILFIALLVFGPSRLPDLGRAMRKTMDEFRAAAQEPAKGISADAEKARGQEQTPAKE